MTDFKSLLLTQAAAFLEETIAIRRHLHQYPELSFEEEQTAAFVAQQLDKWGIAYQNNVGGHGIIALLEGELPGSGVVALRGDMDALPIHETNDVPYQSLHEGVMHACGHDVHTASLLGTVHLLHTLRAHWGGRVKCIFQPGEEKLPGGASIMIREGALERPKPSSIFGQHVYPVLEAGKVGFREGKYMASSDEIYLSVHGEGGHGAMPHDCIDTVLLASQIVVALQQIVSRRANPIIPTVLSFGKIESDGGATNVIPSLVQLEGTFRTMDEEWRKKAHELIRQTAEGIALAMGGRCEVRIEHGYPVLYNEEKLTRRARNWAIELFGHDRVVDLPMRMTAEDFSYYSQVMPACFYRLGTGNIERGITSPVHTSTFDIDESALETSIALMAWLAVKELEKG